MRVAQKAMRGRRRLAQTNAQALHHRSQGGGRQTRSRPCRRGSRTRAPRARAPPCGRPRSTSTTTTAATPG
eukprot:1777648-Heterocapsa_arctica.AAC.1